MEKETNMRREKESLQLAIGSRSYLSSTGFIKDLTNI